ncbi:foxred1, partial [Symbiodinium microadriaticum]
MSMYGAEFLKDRKRLQVDGDSDLPDYQFHEHGYLFLASAAGDPTLRACHSMQKSCGVAGLRLLPPPELLRAFPWLNTSELARGSFGSRNEGYFDPWSLLSALKKK